MTVHAVTGMGIGEPVRPTCMSLILWTVTLNPNRASTAPLSSSPSISLIVGLTRAGVSPRLIPDKKKERRKGKEGATEEDGTGEREGRGGGRTK